MTNIQKFIEDAIIGGCEEAFKVMAIMELEGDDSAYVDSFLLRREAWEAVGKTREESWGLGIGTADIPQSHFVLSWKRKLHTFIEHIADGLSIEDALGKIV